MRKISPPPGFDPRTFQPVASRYTDYAIPAPILKSFSAKFLYALFIFFLPYTHRVHNQHIGFNAVTRASWHINFQITRCLVYKMCFQSLCLLTDLLPLGSRGPHLVRKLPTYDWIRRFITAFTKACPYPEPNPSSPCPPNPSTPGSSKRCSSLMLPHQNPVYISPFPHACYMCCPFQSYWFHNLNNIWWGVQNA
jgi:hypothetical protein